MIDEELRAWLEANAAENRRQFEQVEKRLTERISGVETSLTERIGGVETSLNRRIDGVETSLREHVDVSVAEARRHAEILYESLRHEVQLVAEKIVMVDEKLDREAADIRAEMRDGFTQTQAMIGYSHGELDRRVTALEKGHRAVD
ncbi:MAG TPA: hypothetical protein VGF69_05335 [Thermoanaerobaculia bacterium]